MNFICKKVFLFKEVLISESSLRKAKVALKTDGNSNKSRNNGIAIIMDALYQPEELANMSPAMPVPVCQALSQSQQFPRRS